MFGRRRSFQGIVFLFIILAAIGLIVIPNAQAQYWTSHATLQRFMATLVTSPVTY